MLMRLAYVLLLAIGWSSQVFAQDSMALYTTVPGSKTTINREEQVVTNGILRIHKVTVPMIAVYKPTAASNKGTAIIICPGGSYTILAAIHEGSAIAKIFQAWGITAIVLKYRLPDDTTMRNKEIAPLQDAQRAIQLVRSNAAEWGIDPNRIGIMGFSAGGHVAATASTHFKTAVIDNPSGISLRPDFSILIYPVISFTDTLGHMGSRNKLLGKNPTPAKVIEYSNELQVTTATPPAFLVHTGDDKTVKVGNSIRYYEALIRNKVKAELHLYQAGGHGFGMNNPTTSDEWMERLKNWLQANNWL